MEKPTETVQEDAREIQMGAQGDDQEQELLRRLIEKGVLELKPTLDKLGVHYVEVEEICKSADLNQIRALLKNLEKRGALRSKFTDHVLTCPDCGSPEVYSRYTCPKCDSQRVEYVELLEHMKCGYIGSKDKFKTDSYLVCPNCKARFAEEYMLYRVIGKCYMCEKCGHHFDKPEIIHVCQKCGRSFTYQEARYLKISTYEIPDEAINDFRRKLPVLESVKKVLSDNGFIVQLHPEMTGVSGTRHTFDVLAERNETRLVIDISLTVKKNDAMSLLGKKMDVNPTKAIIIDLSSLDELAPLGRVYDITVLKASNSHLAKYFEDFLMTLEPTEPQARLAETSVRTTN